MAGPLIADLVHDLSEESYDLVGILTDAADCAWAVPTPAVGWTVHDQVAHLAHFDWVTRMAVTEPAYFVRLRDGLHDLQTYVDSIGPANASRDGVDMLRWWTTERGALQSAFLDADPTERVPWFGPAMSLASKVTARIMETWAHGQDVADALGVTRTPTDRLRHVARIGVLAMPNSFRTHGRDAPQTPVRVELRAPSGDTWAWGPDDAADAVVGDALDFCRVVTQRRHVADTALAVSGRTAQAWIEVAQAFAGPPGAGRSPGQFPARENA
ncbi:TIGR03084 family protein [Nocardioides mangrovicus]|uniref:TIGR03084 family protein n=1 Tax=Nocardioides mangrovicus TaxID=2478913 RepID=A0A3L8P726_9ACTN|nr:TIGR03084 family metal-binding protein [Nocardioides mangrovicus]RLV50924.1 TIGR03084 family protein [Nocardioides mangrovicus]